MRLKRLKSSKFTKDAFFLVGLIPFANSGQAFANLLQFTGWRTVSGFDASTPTRKNA